MKRLLFILLMMCSFAVMAQVQTTPVKSIQMQAPQVNTEIDFKFKIIQKYIDEAKQQVRAIIANETVNGSVKNREITKQLLLDLQAVMKLNRPKFIETKETLWKGDSLQTVKQKADLTIEINRLKAEILAGEDTSYIQPKINELTNRRNTVNKIMQVWVPVK